MPFFVLDHRDLFDHRIRSVAGGRFPGLSSGNLVRRGRPIVRVGPPGVRLERTRRALPDCSRERRMASVTRSFSLIPSSAALAFASRNKSSGISSVAFMGTTFPYSQQEITNAPALVLRGCIRSTEHSPASKSRCRTPHPPHPSLKIPKQLAPEFLHVAPTMRSLSQRFIYHCGAVVFDSCPALDGRRVASGLSADEVKEVGRPCGVWQNAATSARCSVPHSTRTRPAQSRLARWFAIQQMPQPRQNLVGFARLGTDSIGTRLTTTELKLKD